MHLITFLSLLPVFLGPCLADPQAINDTYALAVCNPKDPNQYIAGTKKPALNMGDCHSHCWCNCDYNKTMCFTDGHEAPTMTRICKNSRAGNCKCDDCPWSGEEYYVPSGYWERRLACTDAGGREIISSVSSVST